MGSLYVDTIDTDKKIRILLCKYAIQGISQTVKENYDQNFLENSEVKIEFYLECASCLQLLEMDDDLSLVLRDLCTQLKREIEQYQNAGDGGNDEIVVTAYIELGRIYEKCTVFDKAFEAFFKAVICQRASIRSDWFSYRREYFSLNDCGRMKVAMGKNEEALCFFKDAIDCIDKMYAQGVEGDTDDRDNLIMIQETIKRLISGE